MKAIDAVVNLRKLADLLEKHGDVDIQMASAGVWFESKESFIAIARDFPRPFTTEFGESEHGSLTLAHGKEWKTGAVVVPRSQFEAAARLGMWEDFDVNLMDALYECLKVQSIIQFY